MATAIFNQITAQADRLRSADVSLAAQLDLTAYRMRQTPDLYTALVSSSNDRTVRLWNVTEKTGV